MENQDKSEVYNSQTIMNLSFEAAFTMLEKIVAELEEQEQTLDEALRLFEQGQELVKHCTSLLDQAELKVQQILSEDIVSFPTK